MLLRKGFANSFTYECGLRQSTGQAYIHVTEERNTGNTSFMGLILHKYIPDVVRLSQNNWEGISKRVVLAACKCVRA